MRRCGLQDTVNIPLHLTNKVWPSGGRVGLSGSAGWRMKSAPYIVGVVRRRRCAQPNGSASPIGASPHYPACCRWHRSVAHAGRAIERRQGGFARPSRREVVVSSR